jgi:3-phenylpropionate/cinnamic acid dioxygenase small subunit
MQDQAGYTKDRAEIENLQARYMFALDWQDAEAYASTFTEDGILDWARGIVRGRAAIRAEMDTIRARMFTNQSPGTSGPPTRLRHMITNLVLRVDGDRATAKAYWFEMRNDGQEHSVRIIGYGHYDDELRKVNGEWLFASRRINNVQLPGRAGPDTNPAW